MIFLKDIHMYQKDIEEAAKKYRRELNKSYEYQKTIDNIYKEIFDWCTTNHHWIGAYYQRGLLNLNNGNLLDVLSDIKEINSNDFDEFKDDILLLKGKTENELGLYHDAIISLSEVKKNKLKKKEAYFERALAYFENGDFNLAIDDYLKSDSKISKLDESDFSSLNFAKRLIVGMVNGETDKNLEIGSSGHGTVYRLTNVHWAFTTNPIDCSKEMVIACKNCINFIKEEIKSESLQELVPELKELVSNWDNFDDEKKGELIGYVIGKYGIDVFVMHGSIKAAKVYRDLKKANAMLTFEKYQKVSGFISKEKLNFEDEDDNY